MTPTWPVQPLVGIDDLARAVPPELAALYEVRRRAAEARLHRWLDGIDVDAWRGDGEGRTRRMGRLTPAGESALTGALLPAADLEGAPPQAVRWVRLGLTTIEAGLPDDDEVDRRLADGYTLRLDRLDLLDRGPAALASTLETLFDAPVTAALEVTGSTTPPTGPRRAEHDDLLLPLVGRSHWDLRAPTGRWSEPAPWSASNWNGLLEPGMAVVVPRGWTYDRSPIDEPAAVCIVSVHRPTIGQLVDRALTDQGHAIWNHALGRADDPADVARLAWLGDDVADLVDTPALAMARADLALRIPARPVQHPRTNAEAAIGNAIGPMRVAGALTVGPAVVGPAGDGSTVLLGGAGVAVPVPADWVPIVATWLSPHPERPEGVGELADAPDLGALVGTLLRLGWLSILPPEHRP